MNGVTPRRWMVLSNPKLTNLITDWKTGLSTWKNSSGWKHLWSAKFRREWWQIKRHQARPSSLHSQAIGHCGESRVAIRHPSETHSRVQAALNVLHIITLYNRIKTIPT